MALTSFTIRSRRICSRDSAPEKLNATSRPSSANTAASIAAEPSPILPAPRRWVDQARPINWHKTIARKIRAEMTMKNILIPTYVGMAHLDC